jgi:micrococcal nuclease
MVFAVLLMIFVIVAQKQGWLKPLNSQVLMHAQPGSYAIQHFVDGDTVMVDMGGTTETVRFIGIDTPETHKPNTPVQCYGSAAAAYTKNRIGSQRIRLVSDSLTTNRDRYNRLLRYVVLEDGTNLNLELVQKGYAFAYAFPFARNSEFNTAMEKAQAAKAGLWGNCSPYQLPTGQWQSNNQSA